MKKYYFEVQSGELKGITEAINFREALVICIRHQKFPALSNMMRFREVNRDGKPSLVKTYNVNYKKGIKKVEKKYKSKWKYIDTFSAIEEFGILEKIYS